MRGRVLLDLWTEPDIFGIKWDALTQYNGAVYPALPDLYGPTMNAILSIDSSAYFMLSGTGQARFYPGLPGAAHASLPAHACSPWRRGPAVRRPCAPRLKLSL